VLINLQLCGWRQQAPGNRASNEAASCAGVDAHAPTAQVFNHGTLAASDPLNLKAPLHEITASAGQPKCINRNSNENASALPHQTIKAEVPTVPTEDPPELNRG